MSLQKGTLVPYKKPDNVVYSFPDDLYLVTAGVDASHATYVEWRRSSGGHIIMILAAAVLMAG